MPPEVLWLGEPDCHDRELVGGKAAQLSRLAASHPVPPGFCLTADLAFPGLQSELPGHLLEMVDRAYARLGQAGGGDAPAVAVRSSAIDEDGARYSFAGVNETYLNVRGGQRLAEAAVACWQSATSDRARVYRREMGLSGDPRIAVLVQLLVPADTSAVAFSINPVTGKQDEILINASYGLGESIVGGMVTPDMFTLDKQDLRLRESLLGEKAQMTALAESGTMQIETPRRLRGQPALTESQVREIGLMVRDLEQEMGWPVDVECAYHGQSLYLLQCRPVTSVS